MKKLRPNKWLLLLLPATMVLAECKRDDNESSTNVELSLSDTLTFADSLRIAFTKVSFPTDYLTIERIVSELDSNYGVLLSARTPGQVDGINFLVKNEYYSIIALYGYSKFNSNWTKIDVQQFYKENDTIRFRSLLVLDFYDSIIFNHNYVIEAYNH
jgi:hypothetical protein